MVTNLEPTATKFMVKVIVTNHNDSDIVLDAQKNSVNIEIKPKQIMQMKKRATFREYIPGICKLFEASPVDIIKLTSFEYKSFKYKIIVDQTLERLEEKKVMVVSAGQSLLSNSIQIGYQVCTINKGFIKVWMRNSSNCAYQQQLNQSVGVKVLVKNSDVKKL